MKTQPIRLKKERHYILYNPENCHSTDRQKKSWAKHIKVWHEKEPHWKKKLKTKNLQTCTTKKKYIMEDKEIETKSTENKKKGFMWMSLLLN